MRTLESSVLHKVEYDDRRQTLLVVFQSGNSYRYLQVPEKVYASLLRAASHGEFFNAHIRDRYEFERCT